jgi:hypothetical protein
MRLRVSLLVISLAVAFCPRASAVEPVLVKIAPPKVHTGGSESFDEGRVRAELLFGFVKTGGVATRIQFQFGPTKAYGFIANDPEHPYGWNNGPKATAECLAERLQPDTTYHYRLAAWNEGGKSFGQDRTFHTRPPKVIDRGR